jgi:hypothetical protein
LLGAKSVNLEAQFVDSFSFFLIVFVPVQILVSQDPCFPEMGPQMVQSECEPSIAWLFLRIDVRLIQDVTSLNLGLLFAESAFKDVLPPNLVLWVYQGSKDGFTVVGIHLEVLIRQGASNALKQNESKVELCVISDKQFSQGAEQFGAPHGAARAAKNVPGGFSDVETWGTGVGGRLFDPVHVPASGEEIVCEFDDEYFCAVLQSVQSLTRSLPVDGSEGWHRSNRSWPWDVGKFVDC